MYASFFWRKGAGCSEVDCAAHPLVILSEELRSESKNLILCEGFAEKPGPNRTMRLLSSM